MLHDEFPCLIEEWDFNKNNDLDVSKVYSHSRKYVWWKCGYGHEWQARVFNRTSKNPTNCPYCRRQKLEYKDSLYFHYPDVVKEWDYVKNLISPKEVLPGSTYKAYWKCKYNHTWKAQVYHRVNGTKCPQCYVYKRSGVLFVDIAGDLLEEYSKENKFDLGKLTKGSQKKALWLCSVCNHEWEARVKDRVRGTGCPKCYNKRRRERFKDL